MVAEAQLPRLLKSLDAAGLSHSEIVLPAGESDQVLGAAAGRRSKVFWRPGSNAATW